MRMFHRRNINTLLTLKFYIFFSFIICIKQAELVEFSLKGKDTLLLVAGVRGWKKSHLIGTIIRTSECRTCSPIVQGVS